MLHKLFVFLSLFCIAFSAHGLSAYASEEALQVERALVASNIFKKVCFMMSFTAEDKREDFLNEKFIKFDENREKIFTAMVKVDDGNAWAANFPKGSFVVVLDNKSNNCHLIAQKSHGQTIHDKIKALLEEAKANLDGLDIVYHAANGEGALLSSGFDVKGRDGLNKIVIVASTAINPEANKPEALMTAVFSK